MYYMIALLMAANLFSHTPNMEKMEAKAAEAKNYCVECGMNTKFCILVDYSLHSGVDRLFVWSFEQNCVIDECPVAHGRGKSKRLYDRPRFSNVPNSYLSSLGMCRIAERYDGKYGISYRLDGLDKTNSNVRVRDIVIHSFNDMPDTEIYPDYCPRSRGCVMVSENSMSRLDELLKDEQNVLLYIYK